LRRTYGIQFDALRRASQTEGSINRTLDRRAQTDWWAEQSTAQRLVVHNDAVVFRKKTGAGTFQKYSEFFSGGVFLVNGRRSDRTSDWLGVGAHNFGALAALAPIVLQIAG